MAFCRGVYPATEDLQVPEPGPGIVCQDHEELIPYTEFLGCISSFSKILTAFSLIYSTEGEAISFFNGIFDNSALIYNSGRLNHSSIFEKRLDTLKPMVSGRNAAPFLCF